MRRAPLFHKPDNSRGISAKIRKFLFSKTTSMRKLCCLLSALLLLAGCKKDNSTIYGASFLRSINGSATFPNDYSSPVDQLSCNQSYFTGGASKTSRWVFSFHSTFNNNSFTLVLPSTDSSKTLPIGTPLRFTSGSLSTSLQSFELSVLDGGSVYSGQDSASLTITFSIFDKKATADFTASLIGSFGAYIITQGSFNDIPITYAQ